MSQKFDSRQTISHDVLANLLGIDGSTLKALLQSINKEFNAPLRISASSPADSKLNFQAAEIEAADLSAKNSGPIASLIPSVVASTIDFQTGTTTGATFSVTFPNSTVGFFRRVGFSLSSAGVIQVIFSPEVASFGAIANAGTVFVAGSLPIGWIDVEATAASPGRFKTRGSTTNIIENKVGSNNTVHRLDNTGLNASFLDSQLLIQDATDNTIQMVFDAAGSTGTKTTLQSSQTVNRTLTLPNATDTLVARSTTENLANKTLDALRATVTNDNTATGANASIATVTGVIRLTNNSLTSVSAIASASAGQQLTLQNKTANTITINNEDTGVTASERIRTGTGASIQMPSDSTIILTYDSGSLRWQVSSGVGSGSGSGGSKNYLSAVTTSQSNTPNTGNGDFSLGSTTGWSLGTVGTLTNGIPTGTPTFGSGASGNLSISTVSSNQLAGSYSLSYASSAATTQGNMLASDAFYIDNADQAKVLTWKFYYKAQTNPGNANWSGTSSNSFGVAVYDVTNSAWLATSANFAMTQSSGIGFASGSFQTNTTTTQLRLIVYNVNATSGAVTLYFDDFSVGPQSVVQGTPITDWQSYTPTYGSGYGTVSISNMRWRRVGDSVEVKGTFVTGTLTAANGTISLPPGLSIDTNKQVATDPVGRIIRNASSTSLNYFPLITQTGSSTVAVYQAGPLSVSNATSPFSAASMSSVGGNGETMDVDFKVPIQGWSSSVQMSNDTDTRVVAASYYRTTTQSYANSTFTTINFDGKLVDTYSAMSAGSYTIPVTGVYKLFCHVLWAASPGSQSIIQVSKNGSTSGIASNGRIYDSDTNLKNMSGSIMLDLKAGDVITIQAYQSSGGSINLTTAEMSIERISGPSVIAATEEISAYGTAGDGQSISNSTNTVLTLVPAFDTHGAVSSSIITIPTAGRYMYQATIQYAANTTGVRQTWCERSTDGGSNWTTLTLDTVPAAAISGTKVTTEKIFNFNAGDKIRFQTWQNSGSSITITSSIHQQRFNFFKLK